jgi:hypothetical protein
MAKKERNRGSVDRARAKRGSGQANQEPEMRFMDVPAGMPAGMPAGEPAPTRPTPRPARGSNLAPTSTRPTPNPRRSDPVSRGNAASRRQQSEQDDVLKNGGRGMKAGGKVKKMQAGGKCRGMGAATRGGNFSRG